MAYQAEGLVPDVRTAMELLPMVNQVTRGGANHRIVRAKERILSRLGLCLGCGYPEAKCICEASRSTEVYYGFNPGELHRQGLLHEICILVTWYEMRKKEQL